MYRYDNRFCSDRDYVIHSEKRWPRRKEKTIRRRNFTYSSIPTEIRWRDTPSGTTATTAPNKHQPPTRPFLIQTVRAERKALSSWKDYMLEKLHTFLMATHGCSPAAVPSTLRPGKCVRANRRRKR